MRKVIPKDTKTIAKVFLIKAQDQTYQVRVGELFINDTREYDWGNLEVRVCERVTIDGHAWYKTGVSFFISHLYLTSNEKPKLGDWCIDTEKTSVCLCDTNNPNDNLLKIISTTDLALKLPKVQNEFIIDYCNSNGTITEVDIKNIETSIIIDTKQSYSIDEVIKKCKKAYYDGMNFQTNISFEDWINKNL